MTFSKGADKYIKRIWENQLPEDEEAFLFDLLEGKKSCGFEADCDSDYSLYLAYNASRHHYEGYSSEQADLLKKILYNSKGMLFSKIHAISEVIRVLNENGIIPVLIKGAALLAYYSPEIPRLMGDIDIYIKPDQYQKALSVILENGYEFLADTGYHVGVTSPSLDIDVHRHIYKNNKGADSDIFDDLIEVDYLMGKVYVLSPENMFIHQLANRGYDIATADHSKRHFKWILDCCEIMKFFKPDFGSIIKKAKKLENYYFILLTLSKLTELFPEKFSNVPGHIEDAKYTKWLKCVCRMFRWYDRSPGKDRGGLRYLYDVSCYRWRRSKSVKYGHGLSDSVLKIMLKKEKINSVSGLFFRFGRFIRQSIKRKVMPA